MACARDIMLNVEKKKTTQEKKRECGDSKGTPGRGSEFMPEKRAEW